MNSPRDRRRLLCVAVLLLACASAFAQGNYEIQVYGSELTPKGSTMLEFHTNFTVRGTTETVDGVLPTEHQFHETIEITHGWTEWLETGFYIFTSAQPGYGYKWVGSHIRPRVAVPQAWKWPVGLSLSTEIGYQRPLYSSDTWTWEIRPIVDKNIGPWYLSFNPTFDRSFHGPGTRLGFEFSPNFKASYDVTKVIAAGIEYYGALGPVNGFDPLSEQQQQIIPVIDLNFSPQWEFNFGVGIGMTRSTDHLIVKWILGRRFGK